MSDWASCTPTDVVDRIHAGGKRTLIEGPEHRAQLELARHAGVELAQGFLYAPPLTLSVFATYIQAHVRTAPG